MIFDITRPIHPGMALYPGNPEVIFERVQEASATANALTKITLGSHTGTHIDAPSHIATGAPGASSYTFEQLIGEAQVIELGITNQELRGGIITAADLPETSSKRILVKTKNSTGDPNVFDPNFVALDESAAQEFVERGVKLIGIDGPSIKKKGIPDRTHAILLDANVVVLEGLWLADATADSYELLCLPLAVDLDGSPVRAVLQKNQ